MSILELFDRSTSHHTPPIRRAGALCLSFSRDLLKHSAIYGLGQILARLASIILLPLYTRYLTPADYGILSVIDLAIGVLALVAAGGLAGTVNLFHFDVKTESDRHCRSRTITRGPIYSTHPGNTAGSLPLSTPLIAFRPYRRWPM